MARSRCVAFAFELILALVRIATWQSEGSRGEDDASVLFARRMREEGRLMWLADRPE